MAARHVALVLALLVVAGCVSRPPAPPATRTTPEGTVELFKVFARQGDSEGEWDILSPNLKARMSQQFGRTVDLADYIQARNVARTDPNLRRAERALQTVFVQSQQEIAPGTRLVTVVASEGPFSQAGQIRMIELRRWELTTRDSAEPFWGIVGDPEFGVDKLPDGSYRVWYQAPGAARSEQVVPANQVTGYTVDSRWYVDDLGGLEQHFMGQ